MGRPPRTAASFYSAKLCILFYHWSWSWNKNFGSSSTWLCRDCNRSHAFSKGCSRFRNLIPLQLWQTDQKLMRELTVPPFKSTLDKWKTSNIMRCYGWKDSKFLSQRQVLQFGLDCQMWGLELIQHITNLKINLYAAETLLPSYLGMWEVSLVEREGKWPLGKKGMSQLILVAEKLVIPNQLSWLVSRSCFLKLSLQTALKFVNLLKAVLWNYILVSFSLSMTRRTSTPKKQYNKRSSSFVSWLRTTRQCCIYFSNKSK